MAKYLKKCGKEDPLGDSGCAGGPVTKWHSPYRSFHMVLFWHAGKITYLKETDWSSLTVCIIPLAWSLMLLLILYSSLFIYLSSHRDNRNVFSYHLGSKRMIMTWSGSLLHCYNKISKDGFLVKEDLFSSILEGENLSRFCWLVVSHWWEILGSSRERWQSKAGDSRACLLFCITTCSWELVNWGPWELCLSFARVPVI